jgi:hypothetical protein
VGLCTLARHQRQSWHSSDRRDQNHKLKSLVPVRSPYPACTYIVSVRAARQHAAAAAAAAAAGILLLLHAASCSERARGRHCTGTEAYGFWTGSVRLGTGTVRICATSTREPSASGCCIATVIVGGMAAIVRIARAAGAQAL